MGASLKKMAELLEQMSRMQYRHWVCPDWVATSVDRVGRHMSSGTSIRVLNLNSEPVDVRIDFFDEDGNLSDQSTILKAVPPRRTALAFIIGFGTTFTAGPGWVEITCSKPIYPIGWETAKEFTPKTGAPEAEIVFPAVTVYPLVFYPIFEKETVEQE